MKIEKLTDNKIRIILNLDELSKNDLDIKNIAQNSDKAQSLFKSILKEAEKQVGFSVQNCRVFVEIFSTSEGFIIFTLTRYKNSIPTENSSKKVSFKRKNTCISAKNAIYKFNNFEEFCNFCTYCNNTELSNLKGLCKNISLYIYNNLYYLVFSNINVDYKNINLFYTSISEFSNLVSNSAVFKGKLSEHGKMIFRSNAISNGIKYFV